MFLLPISIRFCYLDHLVANSMPPSVYPHPCGMRWGSWFRAIRYHISTYFRRIFGVYVVHIFFICCIKLMCLVSWDIKQSADILMAAVIVLCLQLCGWGSVFPTCLFVCACICTCFACRRTHSAASLLSNSPAYPRDWLQRTSLKWPILCHLDRRTINLYRWLQIFVCCNHFYATAYPVNGCEALCFQPVRLLVHVWWDRGSLFMPLTSRLPKQHCAS